MLIVGKQQGQYMNRPYESARYPDRHPKSYEIVLDCDVNPHK